MHTTRLWMSGVFSTTTMYSPCGPSNPSSLIAAVPSARRRSLKAGSAHAGAALELVGLGKARLDRKDADAREPVLEVARRKVVGGLHALDRVAELAATVGAEKTNGADHHPKRAALPGVVEHRLGGFV